MLIEPLYLVLAVAGLLVGATGTWSPCGFSMIETIGPTGHSGGLRTTLAAAATFAPFAVLGGALTFGLLGLAGEAAGGSGGTVALILAAAVALAAAYAEARGLPIVPQVRRQLPIGWRRRFPMPLAAAGYGVLLGLGFTTFVLSYGVWALMGVSLALADPTAGLFVGVAFGVGRAVPIVVLAPLADRPAGERACEAMAMRPGLLRGARLGDAVALLAVAAVLIAGGGLADAAKTEVKSASDPSASGDAIAFEPSGGGAVVETDGKRTAFPGTDPGIGGRYLASVQGGRVVIRDRKSGVELVSVAAKGADAVAVSSKWLAIRRVAGKRDVIVSVPIGNPARPGKPRRVASAKGPSQLSRPAVGGSTIVYALAKRSGNSLIKAKLHPNGAKRKRKLLSSRTEAFAGPSISAKKIAYVATDRKRQTLRLKGLGKGRGRALYRRGRGIPTLWTTAIAGKRVYVTVVRKGGAGKLISVRR